MGNITARVAKAAKFYQVIESLERPRPSFLGVGDKVFKIQMTQEVRMEHLYDPSEKPCVDYYIFRGGYTVDYPMVISRN